ncbi:Protein TSSC4 [Hirschfeldia incana]|nr:Protein TSSC4 [Hirschfeldia incana]
MADEDFQSRVERIFGSLAFSRSSSSSSTTSSAPPLRQTQSSSVWTLPGTEVEKREWKRDSYDREETPCASSFDEILRQQRISPSASRKEGEEGGDEDFDDGGDWSIRASMGLDRTLDDEEEEDEYDKVALGKEDGGKGLSMKDAISRPCGMRIRDPRANLVAAKIRLKEDELEANKSSPSGDIPSKSKEPTPHPEESSKAVGQPKPILKRKESCSDSEAKTSKRVRFDVVSEETPKKPEDTCSVSASLKSALPKGRSGAQVPDYLINPSKYTCYSFDPSSESNEKSQTQEYTDIPKDAEGLESSESESFKKVSFVPQKKTKDVIDDSSNCTEAKPILAGQVAETGSPIGTEDGDTEIEESESCNSLQRNGRQYRAKQSVDETDV